MKIRYVGIYAAPYKYGPLAGLPTIHLELFGCNLTCSAMNNPKNEDLIFIDTQEGKADRTRFTVGCSHRFAWDTDYFHATTMGDAYHIADAILKLVGPKGFFNRSSVVLSIGGGEPLLQQESIVEILKALDRRCAVARLIPPSVVSIETNSTQHLKSSFKSYLTRWRDRYSDIEQAQRTVHFLNSPKLSISGEDTDMSIMPSIILEQFTSNFGVSLVFPTRYKTQDFDDIVSYFDVCKEYIKTMGTTWINSGDTSDYMTRLLSIVPYVFPVGITPPTEKAHEHMAMRYGFIYNRNYQVSEVTDCLS